MGRADREVPGEIWSATTQIKCLVLAVRHDDTFGWRVLALRLETICPSLEAGGTADLASGWLQRRIA